MSEKGIRSMWLNGKNKQAGCYKTIKIPKFPR